MTQRCRTCKTEVRWIRMISGRWMPIDAEPSNNGNVAVREDGHGEALGPQEAAEARAAGATLFVSPFASCPDADEWRDQQLTLDGAA